MSVVPKSNCMLIKHAHYHSLYCFSVVTGDAWSMFNVNSDLLHSGNGIGDTCEDDFDGDGVSNEEDACPKNSQVTTTDLKNQNMKVDLAKSTSQPAWMLLDNVS